MTEAKTSARSEETMFSINLRRLNGEAPTVSSCLAYFPNVNHRIRFPESNRLSDVFHSPLAVALGKEIECLSGNMEVLAKPTFSVELPGLVLAGLRIIVSREQDGEQTILIRFKHFIGALQAAFLPSVGFDTPRIGSKEEIAISVLDDIVRPLYDLVSTVEIENLPEHHRKNIEQRLHQISKQTVDLKFYSSLLMRYISQTQSDGNSDDISLPDMRPTRGAIAKASSDNLPL